MESVSIKISYNAEQLIAVLYCYELKISMGRTDYINFLIRSFAN